MITSEQRKSLKKYLGFQYVKDIQQALSDNNCNAYSAGYIKRVFGGHEENKDIEMCIWKVASVKKQEQIEAEEIKNNLLNS